MVSLNSPSYTCIQSNIPHNSIKICMNSLGIQSYMLIIKQLYGNKGVAMVEHILHPKQFKEYVQTVVISFVRVSISITLI